MKIAVPELGLKDCIGMYDAIREFTDDVWVEEPLPGGRTLPDGTVLNGGVRIKLPRGLHGAFIAIAALVEAGEVECYARRNDASSPRERIWGLLQFSVKDGLLATLEGPGGTVLYEPAFRRRRIKCRRAMEEIKREFARRLEMGTYGRHPNITHAAHDLLKWAEATLQPDGEFPKETSVRGELSKLRARLAGLA